MTRLRWQAPAGRATIQSIITKLVLDWKDGLRDWQLDLVARTLDGESVLAITATGDGKSALYGAPMVVWQEISRNPDMYDPALPRLKSPVTVIVNPTKGLANNIIYELSLLGVVGLAYTRETLADARRNVPQRRLEDEITECRWRCVCVDPEHLAEKEWEVITNSTCFRENIALLCTEEAHLINQWGMQFRPLFKHIGPFARGRLPSRVPVLAITATLQPGDDTDNVCESLGFCGDNFHLLRRSNERANVQFIRQTLSHGLGGREFPDLLPILQSGRKAVIFCGSLDLVWRAGVYLWRSQPVGSDVLRRVRLYYALNWDDYNEETTLLMRDDPYCQVVVATVAFGQGFNVKSILDCVQLGMPSTGDQLWQQNGRPGRDPSTLARGIVLVQPATVKAAEKFLKARESQSSNSKTNRVKVVTADMDVSKARIAVEKRCLNALANSIWGNEPFQETLRDCITVGRKLPCSNCLPHFEGIITFEPSPLPADGIPLPPFTAAAVSRTMRVKTSITKEERASVQPDLVAFRQTVWLAERDAVAHPNFPLSSFIPITVIDIVLGKLMDIHSEDYLRELTSTRWRYCEQHAAGLYALIQRLQGQIRVQRDKKQLRKQQKAAAVSSIAACAAPVATTASAGMTVEYTPTGALATEHVCSPSAGNEHSSLQLSPMKPSTKRKPLGDLPVDPGVKRAPPQRTPRPRARPQSMAEVAESFRPAYRTGTQTRNLSSTAREVENNRPRRSTRFSR